MAPLIATCAYVLKGVSLNHIVLYIGGIKLFVCLSVCHVHRLSGVLGVADKMSKNNNHTQPPDLYRLVKQTQKQNIHSSIITDTEFLIIVMRKVVPTQFGARTINCE